MFQVNVVEAYDDHDMCTYEEI